MRRWNVDSEAGKGITLRNPGHQEEDRKRTQVICSTFRII
jgi:hypothetical protein